MHAIQLLILSSVHFKSNSSDSASRHQQYPFFLLLLLWSFSPFPVALLWVLCLNLHNEDEVMVVIFGSQCLPTCNPCKVPGFLPAQKSAHNAFMGGLFHNAWRRRQNFLSSFHIPQPKTCQIVLLGWHRRLYRRLTTAKVKKAKGQPWKSYEEVTTLRSKYSNIGPAWLTDCPNRRLTYSTAHAQLLNLTN